MTIEVSLLSLHTESLSASAGRLGSLTSNSDAPEMSKTSVILGLSQSLEILSEHGIQVVGNELGVRAVSWVLLSIQEPLWDVVLSWSSNNIVDLLDLFIVHFSRSLVGVDLSNFESEEGESSTNTLNLSETEWSLLFTVHVCVLHSENVFEIVRIRKYQRCHIL